MQTQNKSIEQMNEYGANDIPFFFLIDFENKKPIVLPLDELANNGISFVADNTEYGKEIKSKNCKIVFSPLLNDFEEYRKKIEIVQEHIANGDSYLLNLTQRTKLDRQIDLEAVFCNSTARFRLLKKNDFVCFSPEIFVQIKDNHISSFPMKGTISTSVANAEEVLMNNSKEIFEHYTITDLIRNDISIVAKNVEVERFRYIEKIKTQRGEILQTSSEIVGVVPEDWQNNIGDIIYKQLPAGSISGAPKAKSVEIIRKAEKEPRGYYTGVCGIYENNKLNSGVVIRYIENVDGESFYRSGGGITHLSTAQEEFDETIDKIYV